MDNKNITYYEKNKENILKKLRNKYKNKSVEEKDELRQYNREYYNKVRKKRIDCLNKIKKTNINKYETLLKNKNKKEVREITNGLMENTNDIKIEIGKFKLEF
jgi:hypothetical protein